MTSLILRTAQKRKNKEKIKQKPSRNGPGNSPWRRSPGGRSETTEGWGRICEIDSRQVLSREWTRGSVIKSVNWYDINVINNKCRIASHSYAATACEQCEMHSCIVRYNRPANVPQNLSLLVGIWTSSNTWVTWTGKSQPPNGISIDSAAFPQPTRVPNTHRHTIHATCDICSNRPHLCIAYWECGLTTRLTVSWPAPWPQRYTDVCCLLGVQVRVVMTTAARSASRRPHHRYSVSNDCGR